MLPDNLPAFLRLFLCLLCSVSLHSGLAFYDWGMDPGEAHFADAPVAVSFLPARDVVEPEQSRAPKTVSTPVPPRPDVGKVEAKQTIAPPKRAATPPANKLLAKMSGQLLAKEKLNELRDKPDVQASSDEVVCMLPQKVVADESTESPEQDQSSETVAKTDTSLEEAPRKSNPQSVQKIEKNLLSGTATSSLELIEAIPNYRSNPLPEYPYRARLKHWQGVVWLLVDVSADGSVDDLRVEQSCGHPLLDKTARRAVRRWQFTPAKRGGMPVLSQVRIPVRFDLKDD